MMRVPLAWRCLSKSMIERYRSCQIALSSCGASGIPSLRRISRVHADDQHLLVIGSVENADPPAFRQIAGGAPEKIVLQFGGAGMLEAEYLAALRVDPGHDVLDGAVFSRRIHRLKDQQDGIAVGCVEKLLLRTQLRNVFFQKLLVLLFRLVDGIDLRRPLFEIDLVSFPHAKIL